MLVAYAIQFGYTEKQLWDLLLWHQKNWLWDLKLCVFPEHCSAKLCWIKHKHELITFQTIGIVD